MGSAILDATVRRLESFSCVVTSADDWALNFITGKVESQIRNECNANTIPEGLFEIAVDMIAGEFLLMKKTSSPESLSGLDLDAAVKRVKEGDTDITYATGEGSSTPEQRLDALILHLMNHGKSQFSSYRRLRW